MKLMLIKSKFLKENPVVKMVHLNTSLDIMITMSLDHYV